LADLRKSLSDITSISGIFVQSKKLDFLEAPLISKGVFHFSRPDYLLWEYAEPAPSRMIIESGMVRAWTGPPDDRVKQPEAMAEAARLTAGQVMIWMKMDSEAIEATYEVSIIADRPLILKVVPRRGGTRTFIEHLEIEFSPDERTVRRVVLFEPESRTTLTFDRVTLNRPRPAE
jgi:outer membrane lipoprotein-sorting protein